MKTPVIALLSTLVLYPGWTHAATPATLNLPLAFEANHGQSDPAVKFLAHDLSGAGYTLFLTEDSAVFETGAPGPPAVRMKIGASRKAGISGTDPLPGKVNYLIGNDPAQWITGAPAYRGVVYKHIYPGVDLFFHGSQRQLEYDFVVAPGADASQIALEFSGAQPRLDSQGNLEVPLPIPGAPESPLLRFRKPVVYQSTQGKRTTVAARYRIRDGRVRFELGPYDRGRELVIDLEPSTTSLFSVARAPVQSMSATRKHPVASALPKALRSTHRATSMSPATPPPPSSP